MGAVVSGKLVTADELLAMGGDVRYELIDGVLHEMRPTSRKHARAQSRAIRLVDEHAERHGGESLPEAGFRLREGPDTVRAPDAAWLSPDRAANIPEQHGFLPGAPDLAIEVVSPNDRFGEVQAKALQWLAHGTGVVLAVDPDTERVTRHRAPDDIAVFTGDEVVDCAPTVPGFTPAARALLGA